VRVPAAHRTGVANALGRSSAFSWRVRAPGRRVQSTFGIAIAIG
jgi:hypothetical protein